MASAAPTYSYVLRRDALAVAAGVLFGHAGYDWIKSFVEDIVEGVLRYGSNGNLRNRFYVLRGDRLNTYHEQHAANHPTLFWGSFALSSLHLFFVLLMAFLFLCFV